MAEIKDEKYEELAQDMVDTIFGYDSKLTRQQWTDKVSKECAWVFDPKKIRDALGYKL